MSIDFIGIGAQKAGTSWLYACLYEHPEVCAPQKEIHFFSRDRFAEGREWYEKKFRRCSDGLKRGEFSTSYLYDERAAERIASLYPAARIIAVLRHPYERAYSQYRNAIKAGEVAADMSFSTYVETTPSCLKQGHYATQLERYYRHFSREQVLVLIYEDCVAEPKKTLQHIYRHIGVDETFVPPSLAARVNVARTPRLVWVDKAMHRSAEALRAAGLDTLVHRIKTSGLTDLVRGYNTQRDTKRDSGRPTLDDSAITAEVERLSTLLGRDMNKAWKL